MSVVVRPAKTSDVKKIRAIVDAYASERKLLSKETVTLFESVQEFTVAEINGEVVGCGALHVLWEDLAEVRTVAVIKSMHSKGIGHAILENILNKAKEVGVKKVFCLTFETKFFGDFTQIETIFFTHLRLLNYASVVSLFSSAAGVSSTSATGASSAITSSTSSTSSTAGVAAAIASASA